MKRIMLLTVTLVVVIVLVAGCAPAETPLRAPTPISTTPTAMPIPTQVSPLETATPITVPTAVPTCGTTTLKLLANPENIEVKGRTLLVARGLPKGWSYVWQASAGILVPTAFDQAVYLDAPEYPGEVICAVTATNPEGGCQKEASITVNVFPKGERPTPTPGSTQASHRVTIEVVSEMEPFQDCVDMVIVAMFPQEAGTRDLIQELPREGGVVEFSMVAEDTYDIVVSAQHYYYRRDSEFGAIGVPVGWTRTPTPCTMRIAASVQLRFVLVPAPKAEELCK